MNVPLLKKIIAAIKREPRRFVMQEGVKVKDRVAPCGTTACIAGFAVLLSQKQDWAKAGMELVEKGNKKHPDTDPNLAPWDNVEPAAKKLLRIKQGPAKNLFYLWRWPDEFKHPNNYGGEWPERTVNQRRKLAEVAIARIKHFIKTKGKE